MVLLRRLIGDVLRRHRLRQSRTLRDVSAAAQVSLGYLSEVERGRKEASSELLAAICVALDVSLADVLREVSADLAALERRATGRPAPAPLAAPPSVRVAAAPVASVRAGSVQTVPVVPVVPAVHSPAALLSTHVAAA
ncbi:MAG TPA: helix-turn-helix transcriptional regulator [Mycobacteriales bacterium]|nr:helix-turn-helix transcriptional regulator [Mycobacteriales bacterium]